VGNDTDPFNLETAYVANDPFDGTPSFTMANSKLNPNLRPEKSNSSEAGLELKFVNNRLGLDVTYYNVNTIDQIMRVPVSSTYGYTSKMINAGQIKNSGIEMIFYATPLKMKDGLTWDITINYAKNTNEVVELDPESGIDEIQIGSYWSASTVATVGQPYGNIVGNAIVRDDAGNIVVDAAGFPQRESDVSVVGNIMPDWIGGIKNSFSYKNFNLNCLIDMRKGGDFYSMSYVFGLYAGVLEETLEGREDGIIVDGVKEDGTPNDIVVAAEDYWGNAYTTKHETGIIDGSFVKLRELSLSYKLPQGLIQNTPFTNLTLSAVGRNLAILSSNSKHLDPETAFGAQPSSQGFEYGQHPSARSIGFSLRANF
jgi:hypothetical protein